MVFLPLEGGWLVHLLAFSIFFAGTDILPSLDFINKLVAPSNFERAISS